FTSNAESPSSGDWYGIYLNDSNADGSFKYNRIEYATYGIRSSSMYGSTNDTTRITNSRIHHSGSGIYMYQSGRYKIIENNTLHDLSGDGINVRYGDGSGYIRNNTIYKANGNGITVANHHTFDVSQNMIDGKTSSGSGIYIERMKNITVRKDTIQNTTGTGIYIEYSSGYAASQWKVVSNVIKDNGSYGVRINYASVNVDSNTISGHSSYGVRVQTNFEQPAADTLRYNTIINNGSYGIRVNEYAGPFVQYNDLYGHSNHDYYNNATTGNELDARYNFWGTATTIEMNAGNNPKDISKIYDKYDNDDKGFVNYGGWLASSGGNPTSTSYTGILKLTDSDGTEQLNFPASSTLYLRVTDSDRNSNSGTAETFAATIKSQTETTAESVTLTETGVNTGIFSGSIAFEVATSFTNGDSKLQVSKGDKLTGTYIDPADD
ncbi:uncharacterized protein METZ01_LOCUS266958, partial [marine metagenome]